MNTKAIIASTLFTAIFAATTAIAGDNDYSTELTVSIENSTVVPFVIKHAYLVTTTVTDSNTEESINK